MKNDAVNVFAFLVRAKHWLQSIMKAIDKNT
jgi:hypothetical protein